MYIYLLIAIYFLIIYTVRKLENKSLGNKLVKMMPIPGMVFGLFLFFTGNVLAACPDNLNTCPDTYSGTFTSSVIDMSTSVTFTTLDWTDTLPSNTDIEMQFRAGPTGHPTVDGSWTSWSSLMTTSNSSIASYAGNRYVQYRALLGSNDVNNSPTLNSVTINVGTNYYSTAELGNPAVGGGGLVFDAGVGNVAYPDSLNWTATTSTDGQKVKFKVRSASTLGLLASAICYGPAGADVTCADWTTTGTFFSQINTTGTTATNPASLPGAIFAHTGSDNRYIEILVEMELSTDGLSSPVLSDVTLNTILLRGGSGIGGGTGGVESSGAPNGGNSGGGEGGGSGSEGSGAPGGGNGGGTENGGGGDVGWVNIILKLLGIV
jgi:hypothetical protein